MTFALEALAALKPVTACLQSWGVPHYVGGSLASSAHGVPRSTADVDIVARADVTTLAGLAAALGADYYASQTAINEAAASRSSFNLIHLPTMFKVDVFITKHRPYDEQALARACEASASLAGVDFSFLIASPEDTILAKLQWYELGNRTSDRQWSDIVGVLRVQQAVLDYDFLHHWATELGVAELLVQARSDVAK